MMGHKEELKSGAEWDVTSKWRHYLCYCRNTRVTHKIKKQMSRRSRREAKKQIRDYLDAA